MEEELPILEAEVDGRCWVDDITSEEYVIIAQNGSVIDGISQEQRPISLPAFGTESSSDWSPMLSFGNISTTPRNVRQNFSENSGMDGRSIGCSQIDQKLSWKKARAKQMKSFKVAQQAIQQQRLQSVQQRQNEQRTRKDLKRQYNQVQQPLIGRTTMTAGLDINVKKTVVENDIEVVGHVTKSRNSVKNVKKEINEDIEVLDEEGSLPKLKIAEVLNDDEKMFLIEQVKSREIIYNKAERNHLNLDLIGKAWLAIQIQFRLRGLDVSVEKLKTNWHSLQSYYKRTIKKTTGDAASPQWTFYDAMRPIMSTSTTMGTRYTGGFVDGSQVRMINNDDSVIVDVGTSPTSNIHNGLPKSPSSGLSTPKLTEEKKIEFKGTRDCLGRRGRVSSTALVQQAIVDHLKKKEREEESMDKNRFHWNKYFIDRLDAVDAKCIKECRREMEEVLSKFEDNSGI